MRQLRPQCSRCIFWMEDHSAVPATAGHCHRYPPGVFINPESGTVVQKFPTTDHHHWCGEWSDDEAWVNDALHRMTLAATTCPSHS